MSELIIRPETPDDYRATECMVQRAFWNIHCPGCNEHVLVRLIRESEDYLPQFSRVAELDGKIVGAIFYTKARNSVVFEGILEHINANVIELLTVDFKNNFCTFSSLLCCNGKLQFLSKEIT